MRRITKPNEKGKVMKAMLFILLTVLVFPMPHYGSTLCKSEQNNSSKKKLMYK